MIPIARHRQRKSEGAERAGLPPGLIVALVVGCLGLFLGIALLGKGTNSRNDGDSAALDSLREVAKTAEILLAPAARLATLSPTPSGPPDGKGRAVYDPATGNAVFVFDRLRPPPESRPTLWALSGAESRFLSTFEPDASGRAVLRLRAIGPSDSLDALALSLEPNDARPQPKAPDGPVILLGVLER